MTGTSRTRRLSRLVSAAFLAVGLLAPVSGPAASTAFAQQLPPAGPAALNCPGFIDPGQPPDAGPGWELRWEWRWYVFNADPIFREYKPMGIAIDAACNVYVGAYSPTGGRVVKVSPNGDTLAQWGADGSASGQFERLEGVAVDGSGNVYAADAGNNRIQKLAPSGDVSAVWADKFRCAQVKVTCFSLPDDANFNGNAVVAADMAGTLYVGDGYQGVKKLNPAGAVLGKWGPAVAESAIMGISLDPLGNVLLAESKNKVVKQSATGAPIAQWGSPGSDAAQLDNPNGVAADRDGNVYVADTDNQRIKKLSPAGEVIAQWGRCADGEGDTCTRYGMGDEAGQFAQPRHLAVNGRGEIVVADHFNYRVQVYKAVPVWVNTRSEEG
jgi:hypothetical protein